jgi:Fe-S oxidoreductase/nitrate reductase gamma subunit
MMGNLKFIVDLETTPKLAELQSLSLKGSDPLEASRFFCLFGLAGEGQTPLGVGQIWAVICGLEARAPLIFQPAPAHEEITRTIMGNIPGWLALSFYVLVAAACLWALVQFTRRFLTYRRSRSTVPAVPNDAKKSVLVGIISVAKYLTFHQQLLRDRYAGIAHLLVFYGFFILFIGTCLVFLEHDTPLHFFYGRFYLIASLIIDLGGVAFLIGLAMFIDRRMFGKSKRILDRFYVAALIWLLLVIGVTGFLVEGARIAIDRPEFERWSVLGFAIGSLMQGLGISGTRAEQLHRWLWGGHAAVCIVFFALLPWRFFGHIVFSPISWAIKSERPVSMLRPVALEVPPTTAAGTTFDQTYPGVIRWNDFGWRDLLQADACTTCGRCNEVCPAHSAGKVLRPREIVLGIREAVNQNAGLISDFIQAEAVWSCTTCGACNHACPVGIEVYDKIVDLRRGYVETGETTPRAIQRFESLLEHGNPFERSSESRLAWATGLPVPIAGEDEAVELLYWIGCAGSYDPDGQSVSRAMVKILNHLQINYRVLGKKERCNGDPARRLGEEGLYQEMARQTLNTLRSHGVKRVLTHCPHCFNVFKNEYPQLAQIEFVVEHHSQFLARMLEQGRLQLAPVPDEASKKITFHDPCYLGRGNGDTHNPRKVLAALPQVELVEMPRHGCNSFCCGAGGGSLWLDTKGSERIENQRTAEAAQTGAALVVTGCPFCKSMIEAGRQSLGQAQPLSETMDLAQLIVKAMRI